MGKMGGSRHLKREVSPEFWPIHRKEYNWVAKPRSGPAPIDRCIPLTVLLREMLGYSRTRKEAKQIISHGKISVDGKARRDDLFPVGLMDIVSIPDAKKDFRVLPSEKGLVLHPIKAGETDFKLCRIEDKVTVKDGHVQLNLHDARNLVVKVNDPQHPEEDAYDTLDTLKIRIEDGSILEHFKMAVGMSAILVEGKNAGKFGRIVSIDESGQERRRWLVTVEDEKGVRYQTILDYVFVIGDEKTRISLPRMEGD